jgi:uncharacterized membrane protein
MLDSDLTTHNIMGAMFFDKFDYETMRNAQMAGASNMPSFRTKQVKICGVDCFQDMSFEEWEIKKHYSFIKKEGIHT